MVSIVQRLKGCDQRGYGAFKLALSHPQRFAAAASLSGAVDINQVVKPNPADPNSDAWRAHMRNIFGDVSKVPGSSNDLFALAEKVAGGSVKPKLYQCCGAEDFLYADNLRFRDHVRALPLGLTYKEGPGDHNWAYWDVMIQKVLAWMLA